MQDSIKRLLKKEDDNMILHIDTSITHRELARPFPSQMFELKSLGFLMITLGQIKVVQSLWNIW